MSVSPVGSLVVFTTSGTNALADLNNNLALIRNQFNALVTSSNTLITGLTIPAPTLSSPTITGTLTVTGVTITGFTAASVGPGTFPAGTFSVATLTVTGTLTLTGATVTGSPTWNSSQPITLSTAAQPNITSVGILVSPHMTGAVVDSGGFTVTSGTTAVQALTATTGVFAGAVSGVTTLAVTTSVDIGVGHTRAGTTTALGVGVGNIVTIYTANATSIGYLIVAGINGANSFMDLVAYDITNALAVAMNSTATISGVPTARTYTVVGNAIRAYMAATASTVKVVPIELS